jgi:insertion element IS1 protein InsB
MGLRIERLSVKSRFLWHDRIPIWLWWAIDQETGDAIAFWLGTREQGNLDKLLEMLKPLDIGNVYTYGNYAYYERFSPEVLRVTKKNTQKIERKHLSLRTWCARLVKRGLRFSKTEQMHKIVVDLAINVWFFGYKKLPDCKIITNDDAVWLTVFQKKTVQATVVDIN